MFFLKFSMSWAPPVRQQGWRAEAVGTSQVSRAAAACQALHGSTNVACMCIHSRHAQDSHAWQRRQHLRTCGKSDGAAVGTGAAGASWGCLSQCRHGSRGHGYWNRSTGAACRRGVSACEFQRRARQGVAAVPAADSTAGAWVQGAGASAHSIEPLLTVHAIDRSRKVPRSCTQEGAYRQTRSPSRPGSS